MQTCSPLLKCYIDQPNSWNDLGSTLIVKGWCYGADRTHIRALRMFIGELCFEGSIRLPRPDVKAAYLEAPGDDTGFDVRGIFLTRSSPLRIEAQISDGSWHVLLSRTIVVHKRLLPLWFSGGSWTELMFFQMPGQMQHLPKAISPERFPAPNRSTDQKTTFSIVTPSYQQAKFVSMTMRSVLEQQGVICHYVVRDGGSTDGTTDIIRAMGPPENAQSTLDWTSEPDGGQSEAIARGFRHSPASGQEEIMAWINSDDFYLDGSFRYVHDFFAAHPEVDVIYGHRILVDESGREIGRWFLPPHDDEVLRLNDFVPQETLFWRRRIWDKVGGIDPALKFAMDWDLLLRFQAAGAKIVRVPYFLACFRIHSAQKTSAQMESVGKREIDALRLRTFGRTLAPSEIESHPKLIRYLRKSAWIEFLWRRLGVRHP